MVYVDDAFIRYGRMVMCHMIGDSRTELLAMADRLGVSRKYLQHPGTYKEHFDICKQFREKAIELGAKVITQRQLTEILRRRKELEPARRST